MILLVWLALGAIEGTTITVQVKTLGSEKGVVRCALYASKEGFPGGEEGRVAAVNGTRTGLSATCVFTGVKPGTYAVSLFHDEDDDGELDTNLFGAPSEDYGVSNNKTYAMRPPKWEESTFAVGAEPVTLEVVLR